MKLTASAIDELKLGTSTRNYEAVNRSLSVTLPKTMTFQEMYTADFTLLFIVDVSAEQKLEQVFNCRPGQYNRYSEKESINRNTRRTKRP